MSSSRRRSQRRQEDENQEPQEQQQQQQPEQRRSVASHVRQWQRAVAEREASRLARPDKRPTKTLGHADRKKSAVTSTPFGVLPKQDKEKNRSSAGSSQQVNASWCGPFAVAREMIAQREEARRQRELELAAAEEEGEEGQETSHPLDEAMNEFENEKKRKAHPSLQWKGRLPPSSSHRNESLYLKRQKRVDTMSMARAVPSLFAICVDFLVKNFEYVEGLGDVDSSIRTSVAKELAANGKMNVESFRALAEVGIEALEIVDCSEIPQDQMVTTLQQLLPAGLRYLLLDQAGRCLGPKAIEAIVTNSEKSELFALSVGGAYLMKDADASRLLEVVARTVTSLEFKACPLLGDAFCKSLGQTYSSQDGRGLVELALEDIPFTKEQLQLLSSSSAAFKNVKSLSLRRLEALDDDILSKFLGAAGDCLKGLDLTGSYNLTDVSLASIRRYNPALQGLTLMGLRHLTTAGLEALFTFVENMDEPPRLRTLDLSQLDHEAVDDRVVELAAQASTKKQANVDDHSSLFGGLVRLNIQGSTEVTDASMETLAATCTATLKELNVSFCPHITDKGLGYLVEHVDSQLSKIHIWGCAQLTDEFFDGNTRANDPSLEICGAWMKKSSPN